MTGLLLALGILLGVQAANELPSLTLPAGENAWVLRTVTSGGFTGGGTGSLTISSAGEMVCTAVLTCPRGLVPDVDRSLSALVDALPFVDHPPRAALSTSTCRDCVTITMTLTRRQQEGQQVVRYTWDVTTAGTVPAEALRLHAAITALVSSGSR